MGLESELLAENGIQEQCPWMGISAKEICGLLAIRTPLRNPNGTIDWLRFYWWRKELPQHVRWAGAPEKAVDRDERGVPYLSPRRSFEEWLELKRGESKPWSSGDLLTAKKFRGSVLRWLIHH
jgi:light-regulated signal transduction histidine kinase (bacteriophytochrome)